MLRVRVALAVGLTLVAGAVGVVLSRTPLTVAGTNSVIASPDKVFAKGGASTCQQQSGALPKGTSALRISLSANQGPSVSVKVLSGSTVVAQGERGSGWGIQETVTVPVNTTTSTVTNPLICVRLGPAVENVEVDGAVTHTISASGEPGSYVKLRFEYLRPGDSSWWSLASSVARRMGLGHAPSGTWIVFLLMALMLAVVTLTSRLLLRELR
jgi:hypothetical protein